MNAFVPRFLTVKIVTYNVNGIRSALGKGLLDWLGDYRPEILCLQEIKAAGGDFDTGPFEKLGYQAVLNPATCKKGYSGVAVFAKPAFGKPSMGIGIETFDREGRVLTLRFDGFTLVNAYVPSGSSGEERQAFKYSFMDAFLPYVAGLAEREGNVVLCGDFNICHKPIDIHDPVRNKNASGFLPEERAWMDRLAAAGYVDAFRAFSQAPHCYTWWSFRAGARQKNLGWRIDYLMASTAMAGQMKGCEIHSSVAFSDHCPVSLEVS